MATCLLLFPNEGDAATLSGGSWQIPLANLQDRIIQRVARSANRDLASTQFVADLPSPKALRAVVLVNSGASVSARKRVRLYGVEDTVVAQTGTEETDGWEPVFPRETPTAQMRWRDLNFWSGRPTPDDLAGTTLSTITLFDAEFFTKRITVEFDDQANPTGYLDLGRQFVAGQYEPSHNYAYGGALRFEARSSTAYSRGGTPYHNRRRHPRVKTITFEHLPEAEAYARVYEIQRRAGTDREIFYVENPADIVNRQRTSFLARMRSLPEIVQSSFGRCTVSFEIEEIL